MGELTKASKLINYPIFFPMRRRNWITYSFGGSVDPACPSQPVTHLGLALAFCAFYQLALLLCLFAAVYIWNESGEGIRIACKHPKCNTEKEHQAYIPILEASLMNQHQESYISLALKWQINAFVTCTNGAKTQSLTAASTFIPAWWKEAFLSPKLSAKKKKSTFSFPLLLCFCSITGSFLSPKPGPVFSKSHPALRPIFHSSEIGETVITGEKRTGYWNLLDTS